ncbi:hypothetical protein DFH09DRAFT_912060 [Mycena vulgaris]|nr:hypothetical protein DFH09DRAFT_912060 [Mycena vulgaris]
MSQTANVALILHGYIGSAPEQPEMAFPLRLFEIYCQIHRVCPRFSMDALSKTLSHLHHGTRKLALHDQLIIAYDAYLSIIRAVDARCLNVLGRTGTWYMDNVCPPCFYKVRGETRLKFSWLGAMDGNNSLKLVDPMFHAGAPHTDNRTSIHDRWVSPEDVDEFKDEVSDSQKVDAPADDLDEDIAWLNVNELDTMEAEALAKCINTCVDRWRNAGPEQRKKMYALFAVAGIFLVVCRHGHVIVMCDMIRSGELMKYPLAMVKRILDRYGNDIGLGYDIMCAFFKTLLRSSLGHRVVAMNLRGVVPAFHGHAHNRACQVGWHPLYVEGVRLEDFEECERTFAKSNHLASMTRLTTPFPRKQAIDEHFYFHDLDKHAASGNFIYRNYRQALEKISINRGQLHVLEQRLKTTAQDYEAVLLSEQEYFKSLRSEPLEAEAAKVAFCRLDYDIISKGYQRPEITRVKTRYRTTYNQYLATLEEACRHEDLHGIENRWTPTSKEYGEVLLLMTERRYKQAVSDLERLVVGRLFEMTKLGMSAYKLREKLNQAVKTRVEAIQKALERYNAAASTLDPPHPHLTWHSIINNTSLAEFDWLRETRQDIRELPWAQPVRREAMVLYFGIKRAEEEIVRLNVEIRRLITAMYDDYVNYYCAIAATLITNPPLTATLSLECTRRTQINTAITQRLVLTSRRTQINTTITQRLVLTSRLVGFTGSLFSGEREGREPGLNDGIPPPPWLAGALHLTTIDVQYEEEEDETANMTEAQRRQYHANGLAREEEFDDNLVVELMETLTTSDST